MRAGWDGIQWIKKGGGGGGGGDLGERGVFEVGGCVEGWGWSGWEGKQNAA